MPTNYYKYFFYPYKNCRVQKHHENTSLYFLTNEDTILSAAVQFILLMELTEVLSR